MVLDTETMMSLSSYDGIVAVVFSVLQFELHLGKHRLHIWDKCVKEVYRIKWL